MLAFLPTNFRRVLILGMLHLAVAFSARAQGGPPLLTNDPGTPGNGNWEINIGVMPVLRHDANQYQLPQLDNDRAMGSLPHDTTFDGGGRYRLGKGFILLFMAGRSFSSNTSGQPNFLGYLGVQVLLKNYGRHLQDAPAP
jgi:hypothetical protein